MKRRQIDLHIHSIYSDGRLSPQEIVNQSIKKQVELIALTDHDTLDGIPAFLVEARHQGIPALYGIEFTCQMNGRDVHILGYNFKPTSGKIQEIIANFQELQSLYTLQRLANFEERFHQDVDRTRLPRQGNLTPIRLAYWLLEKDYLQPDDFPPTIGEIYQLFDGSTHGKQFNYLPHLPLAEDVVERIWAAGGFPVLAHPQAMDITFSELMRLYSRGLKGIEAFYPKQRPAMYLNWAKKLQLAITVGTDYHGVLNRDERSIGFSLPDLPPTLELYTGDFTL